MLLGIILGLIFSFTKAGLERENIRMLQTVAEHPLQLKVPADSGNEVKLPLFYYTERAWRGTACGKQQLL